VKIFALVIGLAAAIPANASEITIRGDNGGYITKYAERMQTMLNKGTLVRFSGNCLSACTIYLALPQSQTCVTKNVTFLFHAPFGAGKDGNRIAHNYMMNKYPAWVRRWIASKGGLTTKSLKMKYSYASKYMRTCR